MLSAKSRKLLHFLKKRNGKMFSKQEIIEALNMPEADVLIEDLRKSGHLRRSSDIRGDDVVGVYTISDQASAEIEDGQKTDIRYLITTGIAVAALIKAFSPEIFAAAAWLLQLLTQ